MHERDMGSPGGHHTAVDCPVVPARDHRGPTMSACKPVTRDSSPAFGQLVGFPAMALLSYGPLAGSWQLYTSEAFPRLLPSSCSCWNSSARSSSSMSIGHDTPKWAGPRHVHRQGSGIPNISSSFSDGHGTTSCKHANPLHRRSMHASSLLRPDSCVFEYGDQGCWGFQRVWRWSSCC